MDTKCLPLPRYWAIPMGSQRQREGSINSRIATALALPEMVRATTVHALGWRDANALFYRKSGMVLFSSALLAEGSAPSQAKRAGHQESHSADQEGSFLRENA